MSKRVRFEPEAEAEYLQAGRWYEAKLSGLGIEFFDEVDATIRQLLETPRIGAPMPQVPGDLGVRRHAVARFPYHVIYMISNDHVVILAISHDRRKPDYWTERQK